MAREVINTDKVFRLSNYSQAFKVGNTIYIAGQAPFDQEMKLVGKGDIIAQAEQTYENLKRVLEAAGATMADIVKVTVYVRNWDDRMKVWDVFHKYAQPPYPPSTSVIVADFGHPDMSLEIEAIAVVQ